VPASSLRTRSGWKLHVAPNAKDVASLGLWTKSRRHFAYEKSFPQILFSHIINFVAKSVFPLPGSSFNSMETMANFALGLGDWPTEKLALQKSTGVLAKS
jgi:hypothetical protein